MPECEIPAARAPTAGYRGGHAQAGAGPPGPEGGGRADRHHFQGGQILFLIELTPLLCAVLNDLVRIRIRAFNISKANNLLSSVADS